MPRQNLTRRSPSGHTLTASWDGAELVAEVAGVHFAGGSYGRAFQIAPSGAHDFACQFLTPATLVARAQVRGRELRISTATDGSVTFASLIGAHYELMTVFSGPAPAVSTIAELFAVLDVDDAAEGMTVIPQRATGLTVAGEHLVLTAADSMSVDVPAPSYARALRPNKRGGRTRRGEVWRNRLPGRRGNRVHDFSYIVSTPRGIAEVQFEDPAAVQESAALTALDSLDVAWTG
ncbi:MAG: hypothetical protein Q4G40_12555 [Brachybacterium sp.]|nr:hypothetical protein [Brachybacterium sp.]